MRIFVESGDFKFLIEDSYSEELSSKKAFKDPVIVIIITIDGGHEGDNDYINSVNKMTRGIVKGLKGEYIEKCVTTVKFDDLSKKEYSYA